MFSSWSTFHIKSLWYYPVYNKCRYSISFWLTRKDLSVKSFGIRAQFVLPQRIHNTSHSKQIDSNWIRISIKFQTYPLVGQHQSLRFMVKKPDDFPKNDRYIRFLMTKQKYADFSLRFTKTSWKKPADFVKHHSNEANISHRIRCHFPLFYPHFLGLCEWDDLAASFYCLIFHRTFSDKVQFIAKWIAVFVRCIPTHLMHSER